MSSIQYETHFRYRFQIEVGHGSAVALIQGLGPNLELSHDLPQAPVAHVLEGAHSRVNVKKAIWCQGDMVEICGMWRVGDRDYATCLPYCLPSAPLHFTFNSGSGPNTDSNLAGPQATVTASASSLELEMPEGKWKGGGGRWWGIRVQGADGK